MLESGLAETIGSDETLGRFIVSSGWVAKSTGRIKHPTFLPAPDNETSVSRITDIEVDSIQRMAAEQLGDRARHGVAVFRAGIVSQSELNVVPHEPPPRHANLVGWAMDEDQEMRKAKRKLAAQQIAEEAEWTPWNVGDT